MSKNILSEYLHKLGKLNPDAFVIQIGANDGISFDDTRGFLDMYQWPALLVEPIPEIFQELKSNFSDRNNYLFDQSAITNHDGPVVMLNVSRDTINENSLHPGYKGMSALYPLKNGFGSDYERDIHVRDNLSKDVTVNGITFNTLLSKHNITEFDVLLCDAEGHDWEIFSQINLEKYRPKIIRLEYMNLNSSEQSKVTDKLKSNNYEYEINGQDIDAVDKSWAETLESTSCNLVNATLSFNNQQIDPSIINLDQIKHLLIHLNKSISLPGDVVELGCFVGESSKYFRKFLDNANSKKELFVYDSFEGLPEKGDWEKATGWIPGSLKTSQQTLIQNFVQNNLKLPAIHKNWFKDIPASALPDKICFAFLDGDFYTSIYDSLDKIFDRVTDDGYICFHDFDRPDLPGVRAAAEAFLKFKGYQPNINIVCDQVGIFQKNKLNRTPNPIVNKSNFSNNQITKSKTNADLFLKESANSSTVVYESQFLDSIITHIDRNIKQPGELVYINSDQNEKASVFGDFLKFIHSEKKAFTYNSLSDFLASNEYKDKSLKVGFLVVNSDEFEDHYDSLVSTFDKINDFGYVYFWNLNNREINLDPIRDFLTSSGHLPNRLTFPSYNLTVIRKSKNLSLDAVVINDKLISYKKDSTENPEQHTSIDTSISAKVINDPITTLNEQCENLTIVSGLWDINRVGRSWETYLEHFDKFLKTPCNLFLWVPKSLESFIWERRSKANTFVKIYELEDIKDYMFTPFWNQVQNIRLDKNWQSLAPWLPDSPQCKNEYYNPVVMSKMFFLNDAKILNPFSDDYLVWVDAGISQTVYENYLYDNNVLHRLKEHLNPFLFLSYEYEANQEIHGFELNAINKYAGEKVDYVCRGGLFGGHKDFISQAHSEYYFLLQDCLNAGFMGTEESIFSIMCKKSEHTYNRYALDPNGLIAKYMQALFDNNARLSVKPEAKFTHKNLPLAISDKEIKTNLYFLTFNFPDQLEATIKSLQKHEGFLSKPVQKIIIDNSTNEEARVGNKLICDKYDFEHIIMNKNTGICGGRQFAAEHFHQTDSDFYLFFEDDMTIADPEEGICRNGFNKFVPNLYEKIHKIMLREKFDFLKLSYTEVYMDNNLQVSWYNVPQHYRTETWPNYDELPITGLDPNCPRTEFKNIEVLDGLSYISGEIYYANWPHITSRAGNKKMFIDTTWQHPYEQTWMSYIFQETRKGNIKPGILLASTVTHDRFKHYKPEDRVEG